MGMSHGYGSAVDERKMVLLIRTALDCSIRGTSKLHRLEETFGAAAVSLSACELADLNAALNRRA